MNVKLLIISGMQMTWNNLHMATSGIQMTFKLITLFAPVIIITVEIQRLEMTFRWPHITFECHLGHIKRFSDHLNDHKLPHVSWNDLEMTWSDLILESHNIQMSLHETLTCDMQDDLEMTPNEF